METGAIGRRLQHHGSGQDMWWFCLLNLYKDLTQRDTCKMSKYIQRMTFMCSIAGTEGQVRLLVCFYRMLSNCMIVEDVKC